MNFLLLNHIIALFLTSATAFIVGAFVLIKSQGRKMNIVYSVWSLSVAWWSFFEGIMLVSDNYQDALFYSNITFVSVLLIAVSTAHFVKLFLDIKGGKIFITIGYALSLFFAITCLASLMTLNVRQIGYIKYFADQSVMIWFNFFVFIVYVAYQIFQLFKAYKKSVGTKRNQIAYVLWASILGYTGGLSNYSLIFDIYIPIVNPFATYLLILYSFLVAMAILKYQLMDIKVVVKKALVYSVGIALIAGLMVGVSFLSFWFAENVPSFQFWLLPALIGATTFIVGRLFYNKSQEVDKLKYQFITVAAHKLRTPLTEIKWAADAIYDKSTNAEEKTKLAKNITTANARLITLTDELLSIAKTEAGQYQYKFEPIDFEKIVRSAINDFQHQLKEKDIHLIYNYDRELPKINADKTKISMVIQILAENAVQYTKNKIEINIKRDKKYIVFSIKDNGIGIKKEDLSYIFSRFYRTHDAYKVETEGAGIGLYLAKSVIDKHGGKIGANSEGKNKGSIFWLKLKL